MATYCAAASISPTVIRPAARAKPATDRTAISSSGVSSADRPAAWVWACHMPCPSRLSSGSARSTRRTSASAVPAAAMVRRPVRASSRAVARRPCVSWYRTDTSEMWRVNARSRRTTAGRPSRKVPASQGSMTKRPTTLPTAGTIDSAARTSTAATPPASAAAPTSRLTMSPAVVRGPPGPDHESSVASIERRSRAVPQAAPAPAASSNSASAAAMAVTAKRQPIVHPLAPPPPSSAESRALPRKAGNRIWAVVEKTAVMTRTVVQTPPSRVVHRSIRSAARPGSRAALPNG